MSYAVWAFQPDLEIQVDNKKHFICALLEKPKLYRRITLKRLELSGITFVWEEVKK